MTISHVYNDEIQYNTKRRPITLQIIKYINIKNCSLSTVLTATDQKPQKS